MYTTPSSRKAMSLATLTAFVFSLFSPFANIAFAVAPTIDLSYSANPAGTGALTITAVYSEPIIGTPLISIDQPGSTDIAEDTMTDLGTGSIFTYIYTVNSDDGSAYIDGTANVSLTGAYNGSGEIADPASNASFTITTLAPPDTEAPVVTLSGANMSIALGGTYTEPGASWTDNIDGSGDIFTGTYGDLGSFATTGSVNTIAVGAYYIDYMKVDAAGNIGTGSRRVDVVSPANLRNATIAPPTNNKIYSNGINQEIGRFGLSAGLDDIRLENIDLNNIGTTTLMNIASSLTGVDLRDAMTNTLLTTGTISGQTISFSGVNTVIPGYTTNNFKVTLSTSAVENFYGETLQLTTNSGTMSIVKDSDNSPLAVDESMFSGNTKLYIVSIVPPTITLTPNPTLSSAQKLGTFEIVNFDTNTGMTLSGFTIQFSTLSGAPSFNGVLCLRDLGSTDNCGASGTTIVPIVATQTGVVATIPFDGLTGAPATLNQNGGNTEYEIFLDNAPLWTGGDIVNISIQNLEYSAGNTDFSQGYIGVSSASMIVPGGGGGDVIAPVVTLSGASTVSGEYGYAYTDDGASWTDNIDGAGNTLTGTYGSAGSFALSGSVDVNTLGTYILNYRKLDAAGNTGDASRNVDIVDTIAPIVTLVGGSPITVVLGNDYTESGATWTDAHDGSGILISASSGSVNTGALGSYTLVYLYSDSSSNFGSANRVVNVISAPDTELPVITLSGSSIVNIEYGSGFTDDGASWTDNVDGSGVISTFTTGSVDVNTLGVYVISYEYTDGAGNVGTGVSRTVNIVDTTRPVVTVSGEAVVSGEYGIGFIDDGATWTDLHDGSGFISAYNTGSIDIFTLGSYPIGYIYIDTSGNPGLIWGRTVNIIDTTAPVVTVSGEVNVFLTLGDNYVESGATWTDAHDGSGVLINASSGSVNTGALGVYTLEYMYADISGNTGSAIRTINIAPPPDTTAPVVTVSGEAVVSGEYGYPYVDAGASWTDNADGAGDAFTGTYGQTGSFVLSGSVDVNTLGGTYTLEYSKVDAAGNVGTGTRTVNIVDTTTPVVTVSGEAGLYITLGSDYTESGASWTDAHDGTGFISSPVSGSVNTGALGIYTLTYEYTDISGNTGSTTRKVRVVDDVSPSVTVEQKGGQSDPTSSGTAVFTVTFSEPINTSTFTTGSLSTSGSTALGISIDSVTEIAPNDGTTFEVVASSLGSGTIVLSVPAGSYSSNVFATTGNAPWSMAKDTLENVYTVNNSDNTVTKITPGGVSSVLGSTGNGAITIGTDLSGNVYTANGSDNTVTKITPGGVSSVLGTTGNLPFGIAVDTLGNIYTTNLIDDTVTKITPGGVSSVLGSTGDSPGSLGVDTFGNVYTTNNSDNTVIKITPEGISSVFGTTGLCPSGISVDALGNVYTANTCANTVTKITPAGVSSILGTTGNNPQNTAIDSIGNVYTANYSDNTVTKITQAGVSTLLGTTGTNPYGIVVDSLGNVYTANLNNSTVTKITAVGIQDISNNLNSASTSTDNSVTMIGPPDSTPPVVTVSGEAVVSGEYGYPYVDDGASWTDNIDGAGNTLTGTYGSTGSFALSGSVDVNTLGTYILEYSKVDTAGNVGTGTRTVNIIDTTAPIVTVSGESQIYMTIGSNYIESGATWTDAHDGSGILLAPTYSLLDTGALGLYTLTYEYIDTSGNAGIENRVVYVVPVPTVSLMGAPSISIEYGSEYTESGASWTDFDSTGTTFSGSYGDIGSFTLSGNVNTGALGTYTLEYFKVDSLGATGSAIRTINVVDTVDPVVTLSGASTVNVIIGDSYTESGATWTDVDGVYGEILVATSGSVDVNTLGTYILEYTHTDSSSNVGIETRTVQVIAAPDVTAPIILLNGSSPVTVAQGSVYVDLGATASDDVDGDITTSILTGGVVNTALIGSYFITYDVSDAAMNAATQVTRTVNVVDMDVPTASISYSNVLTTSGSITATLTGASESIIITNNSGNAARIFSANGSFTFEFSDLSGNTGSVTATVTNIDTTAPVITRIGGASISINQGSIYTDAGATASDNVSGNLTSSIVSSGTVNTSMTGTYTITYTVADTAGNIATPVTRTVSVVVNPPVVIITGGGGGGGSSSSSSVSAPVGSVSPMSSSANNTLTTSSPMTLGIPALMRLLEQREVIVSIPGVTKNQENTLTIVPLDIKNTSYKDDIILFMKKGYVKSSPLFRPKKSISRAEFVKIIALANDFEAPEYTLVSFADVDENSEFAPYIAFVGENGWINTDQKNFRPNDKISLWEAMKILNTINNKDAPLQGEKSGENLSRGKAISLITDELGIEE